MFSAETIRAIERVAEKHDLDPAKLQAVAWVESAGVAYWNIDGKPMPAIRFEGHYFHRLLKEKDTAKLNRAVAAGLAHPSAGRVHNPRSYSARYALFNRAIQIDRAAAIASTSWGLGQVMGANWRDLGYSAPRALADTAMNSVEGQVELMARFIVHNNLSDKLNRGDWHGFARRYNGPGYRRNRYAQKMEQAFSRISSGGGGGRRAHIRDYQEQLKALGYHLDVDGVDGPSTRAIVKAFQTDHGLVADGMVGPMTQRELESELSARSAASIERAAPASVGSAAGISASIPAIVNGLGDAQYAAEGAKGLFENIGMPAIVTSIAVAVVVGVVVYLLIKTIRNRRNLELEIS